MASATENIDRIKTLRRFAGELRGAVGRWAEKYADRKHYDKQGFGFTHQTDVSWNAFKCPPMAFDAHVGTYGSSSVGNDWRPDQVLVNAYFLKALNQHTQAIFDSMAEMAEADAAKLRDAADKELTALRALLR